MCGRFSLFPNEDLLLRYQAMSESDFEPRYNIAPSQNSVVVKYDGGNRIVSMRWGFMLGEHDVINIRAESLIGTGTFSSLCLDNRCIVPTTGFFEWQRSKAGKIPFFFHLPNQATFSLAGLWRQAIDGRAEFAIITVPAHGEVARMHHRMPLIIPLDLELPWLVSSPPPLDEVMSSDLYRHLLVHQVSTAVNRPGNEGPDVVQPIKRLEDWGVER